MADLDDFFAKKDKKKGKSKKFMSSEELVKQITEQAAKEKELKKPAKIEEEQEPSKANQESEDEWKEFVEEEKRPDLTNLKLGQLTIGEKKDNQNRNDGNDYGENDGNYQADGDSDHPWNKGSGSTPAPAQTKTAEPVKNTGAYVPPSLARAEGAQRSRLSRKNAPDLKNQESFPTLGTEKAEPPRIFKSYGFEEVKHGGKQQPMAAGQAPVTTANNWSLLKESVDS